MVHSLGGPMEHNPWAGPLVSNNISILAYPLLSASLYLPLLTGIATQIYIFHWALSPPSPDPNSHATNVFASFLGSWSESCILRKCYQVNEFLLISSSILALLVKYTQNWIQRMFPWILQIHVHQLLQLLFCIISFLLCQSKQVPSQIMLSLNHGYQLRDSWRWVSVSCSLEGKDYLS